jgi:hypothetical protein
VAADDIPIDKASEQADDGGQNRVVVWWKHRSGLEKILICAVIVVAVGAVWHFSSQREDSKREADIGGQVKTSMQQTLDTDPQFARFHLVVSKVDVMHKSDNDYAGLAVVHGPKNVDHTVAVHVTSDGDRVMWQSDPGAFTWAALEQFNLPVPTTSTAPQ